MKGIPTFAPEHFARVRQVDTMKRKQFIKGINQIAQVGCNTDIPGIQYRYGKRSLSVLSECFSLMC